MADKVSGIDPQARQNPGRILNHPDNTDGSFPVASVTMTLLFYGNHRSTVSQHGQQPIGKCRIDGHNSRMQEHDRRHASRDRLTVQFVIDAQTVNRRVSTGSHSTPGIHCHPFVIAAKIRGG